MYKWYIHLSTYSTFSCLQRGTTSLNVHMKYIGIHEELGTHVCKHKYVLTKYLATYIICTWSSHKYNYMHH